MSSRLRRAAPLAALSALLVAGLALFATAPDPGTPLDPTSAAPGGTKALAEILRETGADVRLGSRPVAGAQTVLLLADNLDQPRRDQLEAFVEDGGTLVVADPSSPLSPTVAGGTQLGLLDTALAFDCPEPALAGAARVMAPAGAVYEVPDGATGCYDRNGGSWLVVQPRGEGTVVAVGGPGFVTNSVIGQTDNAVLAVALLNPSGDSTVVLYRPGLVSGAGDRSLADLLSPRLRMAVAQAVIAFGVAVAWRARRLGKPLSEPQAVQLAGSELVVAVGNLLQRTGGRRRATELLREDLHRGLTERLGMPLSAPPRQLAEAAADRTGVDAGRIARLLDGPAPADDAQLLEFAREVEQVRDAALRRQPAGAATAEPPTAEPPTIRQAAADRPGVVDVH